LFRAYVILMAGFLAALGARDLREALPPDRARFWRLAAISACCAAAVFAIVSHLAGKSAPFRLSGLIHLGVVWFGLAALSYLWKAGWLDARRFLALTAALACVDAVGALHVSRPTISDDPSSWLDTANAGYNSSVDLSRAGFARDLAPPDSLGPAINNRNLLAKEAVLDDYTTRIVLRNRFQREMVADPVLSRMATGSRRMWFSASPVWLPPGDSAFRGFQRRVHELDGQPVLLLHSPEQMLELAPPNSPQPADPDPAPALNAPGCVPAALTSVTYLPNLLSFHYDAPSGGYLLVTDRWADGWHATVNGQNRPVLGGDFVYRAVKVDAGTNLVQFQYYPNGFRPLLALSWGTLLVAGLWQIRRLFRT
jgi:hypothetical protein